MILLSPTGIAEVSVTGAGGSSTAPQKRNPVSGSFLVALAHHSAGLAAALHGDVVHGLQRIGGAWLTEWPDLALTQSLGTAPDEARAFAKPAAALV